MKIKLFVMKEGNRKPSFDALEADVNAWLATHPDIVIEHTNHLSHPNAAWSHLALAVWYSEKPGFP